jgi:glycerol-3-phosphate O-acyltransferase
MGAFFVRRKSGNPLYRLVLERYIHMATKEGVCQAVFPEGGLSRNGRLQPPKLGLMDYMLRGFDPERDRDIIFIPVGINYDRILEDRSLIRSLDPSARKRSKWFVMKTTLRFALHNLMLMTRNKWKRFGYASVNFGPHVSAGEYCRTENVNFSRLERDERFLEVEKLCKRLMMVIEETIPIIPVPIVADVLLQFSGQWLRPFDLKALVHDVIKKMEARGGPVNIPEEYREKAIEEALQMLTLRRMVERSDDRYRANMEMYDILKYYANSIAHRHAAPANDR